MKIQLLLLGITSCSQISKIIFADFIHSFCVEETVFDSVSLEKL